MNTGFQQLSDEQWSLILSLMDLRQEEMEKANHIFMCQFKGEV